VRTTDLIQRLLGIKNATVQANAMAQNPQRAAVEVNEERNRLNASIRDRIVEATQLRADVSAEIERRERAVAVAE
jgi:negative regulator of replication initiation